MPTRADDLPNILGRNPDMPQMIVQATKAGQSVAGAAALVGIAPSTLHSWLARGRDLLEFYDHDMEAASPGERVLMSLVSDMATARGSLELRLVNVVSAEAREGDWRAAKYLLESRFPNEWSTKKSDDSQLGRSQQAAIEGERAVGEVIERLAERLEMIESGRAAAIASAVPDADEIIVEPEEYEGRT